MVIDSFGYPCIKINNTPTPMCPRRFGNINVDVFSDATGNYVYFYPETHDQEDYEQWVKYVYAVVESMTQEQQEILLALARDWYGGIDDLFEAVRELSR